MLCLGRKSAGRTPSSKAKLSASAVCAGGRQTELTLNELRWLLYRDCRSTINLSPDSTSFLSSYLDEHCFIRHHITQVVPSVLVVMVYQVRIPGPSKISDDQRSTVGHTDHGSVSFQRPCPSSSRLCCDQCSQLENLALVHAKASRH